MGELFLKLLHIRLLIVSPIGALKIWEKIHPEVKPSCLRNSFTESPKFERLSHGGEELSINPENFVKIAQGAQPYGAFIFQNSVKFSDLYRALAPHLCVDGDEIWRGVDRNGGQLLKFHPIGAVSPLQNEKPQNRSE